jgi:hypothetical protein
MENSWRWLLTDGLAALASFVISSIIMLVSHYYSLGLLSIIIGPLTGGFLATYMVLFFIEDGGLLYLTQTFWHTLLLGVSVALIVAAGFVCAISQHYLFFTAMSM